MIGQLDRFPTYLPVVTSHEVFHCDGRVVRNGQQSRVGLILLSQGVVGGCGLSRLISLFSRWEERESFFLAYYLL